MTGQIHDKVVYQEIHYDLLSVSGAGLFEPSIHGLLPIMIHTACWRGYYCVYVIEQTVLMLDNLTIRTHNQTYPPINNISAQDDGYGTQHYTGLRLPTNFQGSLLLGNDFIRERYVHMGFQAPQAYGQVIEATFESGHLINTLDRSGDFSDMPPNAPPTKPTRF